MQDLFTEIAQAMTDFQQDGQKFLNKGTKAAGTRSRVTSNQLTKLLKQWRQMTVRSEETA